MNKEICIYIYISVAHWRSYFQFLIRLSFAGCEKTPVLVTGATLRSALVWGGLTVCSQGCFPNYESMCGFLHEADLMS